MITQRIARLSAFKKAKQVMFYLPIKGEVNLEGLFEKYRSQKNFILPKVSKKTLKLFFIRNLEETSAGAFKIREPKAGLKKALPEDIECILVPGIVFGYDGHRIGYGKGFYDRLLKKTNSTKIGVAYNFQMVKNIPGESHDVPMNMIVTEKGIIRLKKHKPIS